ncbi:MAG: hypothetical protein K6L73_11450 [Cellvibrionaceae bacterium]
MTRKKQTTRKKAEGSSETSESIAAQTEEFLKAGGKVEVISKGTSGQEPVAGRKHISFAKK